MLFSCSSRHIPAPVEILSTKIASQNNLTEITGDTYTVQKGDTLFAIAFYSGNDYKFLAKINKINAPYTINTGQIIHLRQSQSSTTLAKKDEPSQSGRKLNEIQVDPTKQQAYGGDRNNKHRKNQNKIQLGSNKSDKSTQSSNANWIWPAKGSHTIATVGTDGSKRGLDIKGPLGTDVVASAGGKVVYAGNALKGYGNLIIIKHNDEYLSAYAHNHSILVSEQTYVKQGQKLQQWDVLAPAMLCSTSKLEREVNQLIPSTTYLKYHSESGGLSW